MSQQPEYPWFAVLRSGVLEQGDLLRGCPRFYLPQDAFSSGNEVSVKRGRVDAVILTQSCDADISPFGKRK